MLEKEHKMLYEAFKARDARFDGRFFVAVTSTGIYCRPTCRARMPKIENCIFYRTAAEAEQAGFRPCLTCRPEIAPGFAPIDAKSALAERAARYLEEQSSSGKRLEQLAAELGYTDRYLRQVFAESYHVSPVKYMQTCRLHLAKELLTDTSLSVTDVAMISGFGSIRRFNDVFRKQYRLSPTELRKKLTTEKERDMHITVSLGYRKPYRWDLILNFLKQRAIAGVESVEDRVYRRTVRLKDKKGNDICGRVEVRNNDSKAVLEVTMSESLLHVMPQLLTRVKHLFDLYCDPESVKSVLAKIDEIKPNAFVWGIRVPGCIDPFEASVRAVLGQQITVKAAGTLAGRFAEKFGKPVDTGDAALMYVFPTAEEIAALEGNIEDHLGKIGIIAARARTIKELARYFAGRGDVRGVPKHDMERLLKIKGIGPWTANYIAMRAFGYTDAFLDADYGVKLAFPEMKPKEIRELSERWSPWRSYAMMMLWNIES